MNRILSMTILVFLIAGAIFAQIEQKANVIPSGGGTGSSGQYKNTGTLGQPIAGKVIRNNKTSYFGFLSGEGGYRQLSIQPGYLSPGAKGIAYVSDKFTAVGSIGACTFTATGLPNGLSISPAGIISGIPTEAGTFTVSVTVTDANGNTGTRNVQLIILNSPCYSLNYPSQVEIPTGGDQATFVEAEDINDDGKLDLIIANWLSDNISISLGDGTGGFEYPIIYGVGDYPTAIAVADFDSDGDKDLALCNSGNSNTLLIFLGKNDGTFMQSYEYSGISLPKTINHFDFNKDGNVDLLVSNTTGGDVSIFLGRGDGSFIDALKISTGTSPWSAETADINKDGNVDFIVANSGSNNISVTLGNGAGGILAQTSFQAGTTPRDVKASDLNKDGNLDLVVANWDSDLISILYGDGSGSFALPVQYTVGEEPYNILTEDLNSDGYEDIVVANFSSGSLTIYQGKCNGTFESRNDIPNFSHPRWISSGDFDGDGRIDLVVANRMSQSIPILRNDCNSAPIARCKDITVEYVDHSITITPEDINNGSSEACGGIILSVNPSTFDFSDIGPNTVTLTVTDAYGNSSECQATVTVHNNIDLPEITCVSDQSRITDMNLCTYAVQGSEFDPTYTDNSSNATLGYSLTGATTGSGTTSMAGALLNKGQTTVTWTVTDANGNTNNCSFIVDVEFRPANILVYGALHTTGSGRVTTARKTAITLDLKVFDRTGMTQMSPKEYSAIWNEPDYDPLSSSVFTLSGPTDVVFGGGPAKKYVLTFSEGCDIIGSNGYLVIGKAVVDGEDIYIGNTTNALVSGSNNNMYLQVIKNANGKKTPALTSVISGSLLLLAEPAYIEFTESEELFPVVCESPDGDWNIQISLDPPEGFVSTPGSLSTDIITNNINAVQFQVRDIGSSWTHTKVGHKIKHNGRDKNFETRPNMYNKQRRHKDIESEDYMGNSGGDELTVKLKQNSPNPFSYMTEIQYFVSQREHVSLILTDITGKVVANLIDSYVPPSWNTLIINGSGLVPGVYIVRIESQGKTDMMKIVKTD